MTIVAAVVILGSSMPAVACTEGCTPGFWKNHPEAWPTGYSPGSHFYDGITFMGALNLRGGGINALARHTAAALLNAAHPDINYVLSCATIYEWFDFAIEYDRIEGIKDALDFFNNLGCDL
jgi:hypothetical protein